MNDPGHHDPPLDVAATMRRVYRRGLTTMAGGNISARDAAGRVWITPAGLDKGKLDPQDIVRVEPDGTASSPVPPSSDTAFHLHVYRRRPDLGAIVHAHAPALVAFSIRHETPDTAILPDAARACASVGYVPRERTGPDGTARSAADVFADGSTCAVLENHGVVVAGADLAEAFHRLETLEITAQIIARARSLGAVHRPDVPAPAPVRPQKAPAGNEAPRRDLCAFARRAYERNLVTGHLGSFSARVDDDLLVRSPNGADLEALEPERLVRPGPLHEAIFTAHPDVGAVIVAAPVNATAFSVTRRPFESRTTAESRLLLGDVPALPYDLVSRDPRRAATMVSADRPAALLRNRGVLVLGDSVRAAYARLEAFEATAEAIVRAGAGRGVIPLSDDAIDELDAAQR